MKELSIEEKAKAYDEALKWMRDLYPNLGIAAKEKAESIFHELCESEDEKIRKFLIKWIQDNYYHGTTEIPTKTLIAWLEKQGEHANFRNKIQIGDKVTRNKDGVLVNLSQLNRVAKKDEKQREQKPADKVEPKFHKGEWITNGIDFTFQIHSIEDNMYLRSDDYFIDIETADKKFRLWTIQDAKDGDVLACNEEILLFKSYSVQGRISLYCWYNGQTNNFHSKEVVDTLMTTRNKIYPATKEQRDILFQKMKEEGYEWDDDKKVLIKKIEEKNLTDFENAMMHIGESFFGKNAGLDPNDTNVIKEQANTLLGLVPSKDWSEEDAVNFNLVYTYVPNDSLRDWLKELKNRVLPHPKQEWNEEDVYNSKLILATVSQEQDLSLETKDKLTSWLKSLKPQNHWKPSDEQMEALNDVISSRDIKYDVLSELWKDLNTLKRGE